MRKHWQFTIAPLRPADVSERAWFEAFRAAYLDAMAGIGSRNGKLWSMAQDVLDELGRTVGTSRAP